MQVLRETNNSAVVWGDEELLRLIAERTGLHISNQTSTTVLNNLSKCPGKLTPRLVRREYTSGYQRWVRAFYLPEHANTPSLRVRWGQEPTSAFYVDISSIDEAKLLLGALDQYDHFQLDNLTKSECSAGGLEILTNNGWVEWLDEDGDNIIQVIESTTKKKKSK